MHEDQIIDRHEYSSLTGFAFLFNVMMGNGPLTLPAAFQQAGWLMSTIVLIFLGFSAFITFTFLMEAMSISNAIKKLQLRDELHEEQSQTNGSVSSLGSVLSTGDLDLNDKEQFAIVRKFELGEMFSMYFGRVGNILFYLNICIYLYGDLAIYAAGVPKSLRNVVCIANATQPLPLDSDICWDGAYLTRSNVYRIFVIGFGLCMLPFLFFHVTKSRWLQIITTAIRWVAFLLMLCLAIDRAIVVRRSEPPKALAFSQSWNPSMYNLDKTSIIHEPVPNPPLVRSEGILNLFGICVYVYMCHHSIPGVVTPIRNKSRFNLRILLPLFLSGIGFNLLLSGTASAAFNHINDLYTLNFVPNDQTADLFKIPHVLAKIFGYFLALFPVFALSSTFPILGCTLMGNMVALSHMNSACSTPRAQRILRLSLPFVIVLPPLCIALGTDNIGFLVGFTGAFAGSGIMYIIPALLVHRARRYLLYAFQHRADFTLPSYSDLDEIEQEEVGDEEPLYPQLNSPSVQIRNGNCCTRFWFRFRRSWTSSPRAHYASPFASPFQHFIWIFLLLVWSIVCIVIVLVDKIDTR